MINLRALLARLRQHIDPSPFPPEAHAALHISDPSGKTHYIHCAYCHAFVPADTYEAHLETCADAFFARVNRALPTLPDTPREADDAFAAYVGTLDMTPLDSRDTRPVDSWQDDADDPLQRGNEELY